MGGGDARAGQAEGEKNRIFCDHGLQGIATHLPSSVPMFPHKRIKNPRRGSRRNITARSTRNECWSGTHRQAQAPPVSDPYDGTAAQFNREFNVIMGLVNLNLL